MGWRPLLKGCRQRSETFLRALAVPCAQVIGERVSLTVSVSRAHHTTFMGRAWVGEHVAVAGSGGEVGKTVAVGWKEAGSCGF